MTKLIYIDKWPNWHRSTETLSCMYSLNIYQSNDELKVSKGCQMETNRKNTSF